MGRGPRHLLQRLAPALEDDGHTVTSVELASDAGFTIDAAIAFELARVIRTRVQEAIARGRFPIVLSGNCCSSLGTVSALGAAETAVYWFDAHGDFNTPETTTSGFFDGTSLAALTGRCWRTLAYTIPGWQPLPERNVVLVGARDLDEAEVEFLDKSAVIQVAADRRLHPAIKAMTGRLSNSYVHVDLDVLDVAVGRANEYACAGGLSVEGLLERVDAIHETGTVRAAAFTAYDPACDTDGAIAEAAFQVARVLVDG